ncbi:site-specific DNA-methyltransferase [Selenomonas sp. ND2010]|uniref:site-specific DNA-methyltransferase n=1 Tax=Selenomonas sp. ND2010 TaxID=1410618 RepID=UPI00051AD0BB|nr:site-specific DNA-methyltransferase [Selenomonas sp. ND2010]
MKKLTGESMNITEENLKSMQQLFPEAFEEGKIDFDVLRQLLGDFVDDEQERYSFKWNGKGKALRLSQTPSMGTLRPCKEESKDWDNTENLYIEGDNLEVLKLLQKSYYGKVKMIYIDPPYNTGGDFVYKDNFHDNIQNYKEVTGQIDGEGNKIDTNTESNGRFHTDWLNMMYPRLRLARNLLTEDGVIFISIDDNEQENLKRICDEVFGECNFIGEIIRKTKSMTGDNGNGFNLQHELLIIYAKNQADMILRGEAKSYSNYSNPDNDPNGEWCAGDPSAKSGGPSTYFEIKNPYTNKVDVPPTGRYWAFSKTTLEKYIADGKIKFKENHRDNERGFVFKRYRKDATSLFDPVHSLFGNENEYMNQAATVEVKKIFDEDVFSYPKPVAFIKKIIQYATLKESLVLDFFSGSGTLSHAVMQLNAEDGGHRKFIMVQLPEPTDEKSEAYKAGYKNICEISKERIRRAGDKIKAEAGDKAADLDIGFKVFKLDSSNLQKWNPQPDDLVMTLQQATDNFLPDRTEQDVLYEIMLKMGLDLTCQIEEEQAAGETVYIIGGGALMICLGRNITTAVAEAVVKLHAEYESELWQVVFRDTGFASDMDKTNVKETLKAAGLDEDSFVCV